MRGVSEVIAIILILMITISLAGLAYMFMSTTMSDVTASAGSTVDMTTSSMLTSFSIESIDIAKVYVRNTGQNALTGLSVYVNDEMSLFNITHSVAPGAIGTITIYSFIPDGGTVKVTSPSGFSASKVAHPCEKAIGCWKFDEGSDSIAYDSSPYSNHGTLVNQTNWTTGIYGGGVEFDGSFDYVIVPNTNSISNYSNGMSVCMWIKPKRVNIQQSPFGQNTPCCVNLWMNQTSMRWETNPGQAFYSISQFQTNIWYYVCGTYNTSAPSNQAKLYINGNLDSQATLTFTPSKTGSIIIGGYSSGNFFFNGTIDEVRIYNRAIY